GRRSAMPETRIRDRPRNPSGPTADRWIKAKAKGRLRGKQPKLSKKQEALLISVHRAGTHTTAEFAELFAVARSTVYRTIKRAGDAAV
ncbi:helix-turn-helix domain-containing protein, partial [Pseudarthrobacter oxydans]|uniref:helix-turn-helix domain-containing protein n=1 Tax=Pseudarthrobacter oxydans TaxID=1671 RepID=UPI00382CE7EF